MTIWNRCISHEVNLYVHKFHWFPQCSITFHEYFLFSSKLSKFCYLIKVFRAHRKGTIVFSIISGHLQITTILQVENRNLWMDLSIQFVFFVKVWLTMVMSSMLFLLVHVKSLTKILAVIIFLIDHTTTKQNPRWFEPIK